MRQKLAIGGGLFGCMLALSACNQGTVVHESAVSYDVVAEQKSQQPALLPTGNNSNGKFVADKMTVSSFESSSEFNGQGFVLLYEQRKTPNEVHYYKSIQQITLSKTGERQIVAENWAEIDEQEWQQTKVQYQKSKTLQDLHPEVLQKMPLSRQRQQFLQAQQQRAQQFEQEFQQRQAEFAKERERIEREFNANYAQLQVEQAELEKQSRQQEQMIKKALDLPQQDQP